MAKTATRDLAPETLQQMYAELEARFDQKFSSRITELERKCERLEKEADLWKKKYFSEQKRAEGLQGKLELALAQSKGLEALAERQAAQIQKLQQQIHGKKPDAPPAPAPTPDQPKRNRGKQRGSKGHGRRFRTEIEPEDRIHDAVWNARIPHCYWWHDFNRHPTFRPPRSTLNTAWH